ncbi:hypothetical protein STEG23_024270 [Scotinomys teguina]
MESGVTSLTQRKEDVKAGRCYKATEKYPECAMTSLKPGIPQPTYQLCKNVLDVCFCDQIFRVEINKWKPKRKSLDQGSQRDSDKWISALFSNHQRSFLLQQIETNIETHSQTLCRGERDRDGDRDRETDILEHTALNGLSPSNLFPQSSGNPEKRGGGKSVFFTVINVTAIQLNTKGNMKNSEPNKLGKSIKLLVDCEHKAGERADPEFITVGELALTLTGSSALESHLCFLPGQQTRMDPVVGDTVVRLLQQSGERALHLACADQ